MGIAARAQGFDDIRAAARTAARVRGLSLGDWFDEALRGKAAAMGVSAADLGPDQRIDAVMDRLREVGGSRVPSFSAGKPRAGVEPDPDPEGEALPMVIRNELSRGGEPVVQALSQRRNDNDDDQETPVTHSTAPAASDGQPEPVPSSSALAAAGSRQAAQRVEIEGKLNALFKALDRTPRRQAVEAGYDDDGEDRRKRALLGETAISPSWRLDKAVAEIAERQSVLDRQTGEPSREAAGRAGSSAQAQDTTLRRMLTQAPASIVPSIFTALQADISRLAGTLEAVQLDVSRWPAHEKGPTLDEMRALLTDRRPDASLIALGDSMEKLSSRLDAEAASDGRSAAIESLSRRIEEVHAELTEQLSSLKPGLDAAKVEQLVAEVVARRPAAATPGLGALEAAVTDLAGKLTSIERSQGDDRLLIDMQVQVTRLAERIDRTDAGLAAIVAMERSLGDILIQVSDMKNVAAAAAESAGRSAAVEAVQALMPSADTGVATQTSSGVIEVSRGLAEMRAERVQADERLHAILGALNASLDRVVDRLDALEVEGDDVAAAAGSAVKREAGKPDWRSQAGLVPDARDAFAPAAAPAMPAITWTAPAGGETFEPGEPLDLDLPLEPGMRPGAGMAETVPVVTPTAPDPSLFIAAARRAAQNAVQEQARFDPDPAGDAKSTQDGAPARNRFTVGMLSRRRPLLLALAGLLVLAGAAQIARMSLGDPSASMQDVTGSTPPAPPTIPVTPDVRSEAVPADDTVKTAVASPDTTKSASDTPDLAAAALPPPAEAVSPKALPTMAMGPLAGVAALKAADASARLSAAPGIPVGLQELADAGRPDAQFEVGLRYAEARRVPRDLKAAAGWFEKAANGGLAPAAYRLGSLYEKGLGVSRDPAQSMAWYRKAADAGNIRAMHNLAVMLAEGANTKADYPQAVKWFTQAAEAGVRDSQYNLAILFARGLGVSQDLGKAYVWFSTAAAQGDTDAAKKRDDVAGRLDAAALDAAKAAFGAFKPAAALTAANEVKPPPGGWDTVPQHSAVPANPHLSRL